MEHSKKYREEKPETWRKTWEEKQRRETEKKN
jgi:hypothetical protein